MYKSSEQKHVLWESFKIEIFIIFWTKGFVHGKITSNKHSRSYHTSQISMVFISSHCLTQSRKSVNNFDISFLELKKYLKQTFRKNFLIRLIFLFLKKFFKILIYLHLLEKWHKIWFIWSLFWGSTPTTEESLENQS